MQFAGSLNKAAAAKIEQTSASAGCAMGRAALAAEGAETGIHWAFGTVLAEAVPSSFLGRGEVGASELVCWQGWWQGCSARRVGDLQHPGCSPGCKALATGLLGRKPIQVNTDDKGISVDFCGVFIF